jgi:hypothetical protein
MGQVVRRAGVGEGYRKGSCRPQWRGYWAGGGGAWADLGERNTARAHEE